MDTFVDRVKAESGPKRCHSKLLSMFTFKVSTSYAKFHTISLLVKLTLQQTYDKNVSKRPVILWQRVKYDVTSCVFLAGYWNLLFGWLLGIRTLDSLSCMLKDLSYSTFLKLWNYSLVQRFVYTFDAVLSKFDSILHQKCIQIAGPNCSAWMQVAALQKNIDDVRSGIMFDD